MAWFTIRSTDDFARNATGTRNARKMGMTKERRMALFKSYIVDWVICIVLAAIFFALDEIPGFKRQFSIEDPTLRFPYAVHERVPPVALYFIALVAPFVIQIAVNLVTIRSVWDFHNSSLGLLLGLTLTGAITQFTKVTVGRPRPDVISRCQPLPGVQNPEYGLVSVAICRQTDVRILRDGWRSFPSGHSSLSFAGLGFLSFYLAGKMHLFDEKGHTTKAWVSLAPISGAALVAISRTMDYRHHWQDVLVGSLLGLVMSFFAYRQYYPPLSSPRAHRPFSPRIRRERDGGDGEDDSSSPSEESHAPILPTVRPGLGPRVESHSLRKSRTSDLGHSPTGGGVGGEGSSGLGLGPGYGGHSRESSGGAGVMTHPAVPHFHPLHGGHPQSRDLMYHDEQSVEDLQRGSTGERRSDEGERVEMDGPLRSGGTK